MSSIDQIIKRHISIYGAKPEILSKVPAVMTGIGIFSCYCKGFSVGSAIQKNLIISISKRDDQMVKIYNNFSHDTKRFNLNSIKYRKEDRWGNYAKGIISELLKNDYTITGLDVCLFGSVLSFDGPTVAASVSLGTGLALNKIFNLELEEHQLLSFCHQGVTHLCDISCNYASMMIALHSKRNKLMFFDHKKIDYKYIDYPSENDGYHITIVHSNIAPSDMREDFVLQSTEIKKAVEHLEKQIKSGSFRDYPIKSLKERIIPMEERDRQICMFMIEECACIESLVNQNFTEDPRKFGKVMQKIQNGLSHNIELSCPEVDWIIKRSKENRNCLASCQVYSGQGGVVALLEKNPFLSEFEEKLSEYERIFGFTADMTRLEPAGPACIIDPAGGYNEDINN